MSAAAAAPGSQPTRASARCTARALISLADFGTVPELVEAGIANLRLLASGALTRPPGRDGGGSIAEGLARLRHALAARTLGLDLAEDRLLRIGLSLLESTPQYAAALPAGAPLSC
jgi:hypothetical protein